ncbi:MAG: hypothetical protein IH845_05395 [Nanoarchaeota archaeon]|nr:hypothetical protein [Nanoarchaeota archaeon]
MKYIFSFMLGFFLVGTLIIGLGGLYNYSSEKEILLDKAFENLEENAEEKTGRINDYLSKTVRDIQNLQETEEVKDLLMQELSSENSVIKRNIDQKAEVISMEIENYIRANSKKTLIDLQSDFDFLRIAVQDVGNAGHSSVVGTDDLIIYFHKNSSFVGDRLDNLQKESSELLDILENIKIGKNVSEGFYDWKDSEGEIRRKYGKFISSPVKTADGISLFIATTAYVDDYKIISDISQESKEYLKNFKEEYDYYNLVLISPEGQIIYAIEQMNNFGTNLEWEINSENWLSKNYFDAKRKNDFSFFEPFMEDNYVIPKVSVIIPVYVSNDLLGFVALIHDADKIFEITKENIDINEETYLIDREQILNSPLKTQNLEIFTQTIYTDNADGCFNKRIEELLGSKESAILFLGYDGEETFGVHRKIAQIDLCLLNEVKKEEVLDIPLKSVLIKNLFVLGFGILIFSLVGFFIGKYFERKGQAKIKKYSEFLSNLKLRYFLLFGTLFILAYFLAIKFSVGRSADFSFLSYYIFDALIFIMAFMIFAFAFKLKRDKSRKYLFLGSEFIILGILIRILVEQYFGIINSLNTFYWTFTIIAEFFGFWLLAFGLREMKK